MIKTTTLWCIGLLAIACPANHCGAKDWLDRQVAESKSLIGLRVPG
ncbi:exported hypothetical protein [Mesorhizobium plurifarium]|uniref:Uncharacterized protein n=1 Tax=Mesorhizobium plurifarium TaxID=69974 RepID=A0A090G110_MESPL|nr:exported hypothetical protein [Mesorhizobium plurifarium]